MKKTRTILLTVILAALLVFSFSGIAFTQEREKRKEVEDKELVELLGMTVEAASKREESLMNAPAIVSILTSNDIKELGVHSVSEAINYMPGIHMFLTYPRDFSIFAIRGNYSNYNTKILFLINGHPYYVPICGAFEVNAVPIDAVERIELIRGPVSVMYGTNAMTGVINIVTVKEPAFLNGEVRYQFGSFGTHNLRASFGKKHENHRFFASANYQNQDGYDQIIKPNQDEAVLGFETKLYTDMSNLFLNYAFKGLEVDVVYWKEKLQSTYGLTSNSLFYSGAWEHELLYTDVRYAHTLSEKAKLHFKFRADSSTYALDTKAPRAGEAASDNIKIGGEAYADINFNDSANLLVGALYDNYHTDPFRTTMAMKITDISFTFFKDDLSHSDTAVYANFNYRIADPVNIVSGIRYTDNSITGGHTDYRVGSIFNFNKDIALKLLYGTSYRSPNHNELYTFGLPIISGKMDLNFEVLKGLDVGLFYSFQNKLFTSVNYYWNHSDDFITLRPVNGVNTYVNIKGQEIQGIEFELKYRPFNTFNLFLNSSNIISTKDLELDSELTHIAKNMLKFGFTYKPTDSLILSNSNFYRSDWEGSEAYFLSNLAMYYTLPGYQPGTELFITFNNIFDEEYTFAEILRRVVPNIPGGPPRSVTAGIILSF